MIICTIIYLILYIQHIASLVTSVIQFHSSKKASAKRATPSGSSSPFAGTMSGKDTGKTTAEHDINCGETWKNGKESMIIIIKHDYDLIVWYFSRTHMIIIWWLWRIMIMKVIINDCQNPFKNVVFRWRSIPGCFKLACPVVGMAHSEDELLRSSTWRDDTKRCANRVSNYQSWLAVFCQKLKDSIYPSKSKC